MCAHGHATRRYGRPVSNTLRRVGEDALQDRRAEPRPDQVFRDVRVRRVERMQVRVRLPLLKTEFDLPAEPIQLNLARFI